ncbi:MAG TPA: phosphatase PAP2 family protein [Rectinemataceae bacterium]|nr:phosphatase PAP2 family protein [Rectinemataceae bacterium]
MNGILAWGLDFIRAVQSLGNPGVTLVMKGFTYVGSAPFYILAIPLIYWTIDRKRGLRILLFFLVSTFANMWLKDLWGQPRPFELDKAIAMMPELGHGLPSFHAQTSVVFWGMSAILFPRPLGLVLSIAMPLLIGFSRIYLGVHFPTDVFVGWGLGLVLVLTDRLVSDRFEKLLAILGGRWRLISMAVVALLMNALYHADLSMSGAFLGAGMGFAWADDKAQFSVEGSLLAKIARVVLGLATTVGVYFLFKLITPGREAELFNLASFLSFAFVGFWIAFAAPWLFLKLKLARAA